MSNHHYKVMVVDDSAVVRQNLSDILAKDPMVEEIITASDPIFAMQKMQIVWPDVIVLDIEMPRMDGISFLKKIMAERPTPVVICSSLTTEGAAVTMEAISAGAVDIIGKPKLNIVGFLEESAETFLQIIRAASQARVGKLASYTSKPAQSHYKQSSLSPLMTTGTTWKLVAIGTSTGGTNALETILTALPPLSPPIAIVQHMPEKFTEQFAKRLNSICQIEVKEAVNGDEIIPGRALIAPGNRHLMVRMSGARFYAEVKEGPVVNRHRPSVDVLFRSVAQHVGQNAIGIIMTGMGDDGARGLLEMKKAGAYTAAQDEASSVVFGMPKEAILLGAAEAVLPLRMMATEILSKAGHSGGRF
ncbi:protein-glutamate methylesterase/protein-glutamine glutaminase [Leptospira ilyithenensis]|uniref:Protein-glutamate methylesterase/protein-glutamine glutaminase n=1 Tax=Leptospira ilyithenensis TaxID=2484901 RepID=A0A4R9LQG8_9LEPT|nr:chemotaxis response regulator protein-glutamate methylesterase [Leptospira ilyithenensis]TGN11751.1 chemotaxis response regulator protein-glutamate methylesterase [Leptospira ilyithenensis]